MTDLLRYFLDKIFFQSNSKLIRTGGGFPSTANALEGGDYLFRRHTDNESGQTFCVSRATSGESDFVDNSIFQFNFNGTAANVGIGDISDGLIHFFGFSSWWASENCRILIINSNNMV